MVRSQVHHEWLERIAAYLNGQTQQQELLQQTKLHAQKILEYAETKSSFYREHLSTGLSSTSSTFEVLDGVPFTTKDDLRSAGKGVCSIPFDEIAMYYETTGTTGQPTPCPRASIDVETSGAYVERAITEVYTSTFGTMHALTAIMGPSELYAFGDTYGEICRKLDIPFVRLWPESPRVGLDKAAHLITDLRVRSLICSPTVALALARLYESLGINPRETSVGQVLVLGEFCSPEMLLNISRLWDAHCTHALYGSQEAHAVATGCSKGNLHLSETNYIAEILPVPGLDNSVGELCLTMLIPGAKPLIRFRTGDLVGFQSSKCQCGNSSRCLQVFGRVNDIITLGNCQVLPASIESAVLKAAEWVLGYQVDIWAMNNNADKVEISMTANIGDRSVDQVQKQMADHFGIPVKLKLADRLDPQAETSAYISWKRARIRDHRGEKK